MSVNAGSQNIVTRVGLALALLACGATTQSADAPLADTQLLVDTLADTVDDEGATDTPDAPDIWACEPSCPLDRCAAQDGCGGPCPACPAAVSCATCQLRLTILELTRDRAGLPKLLTLGLQYIPSEGGVLPRVADIRLRVTGPATFLDVTAGAALIDAGKALATDPNTGLPVQIQTDGVLRTVVLAGTDNATIGGGLWLSWRFRLGGAFEPMDAPVEIRLLRDEPILAPPPAELAAGDPATLAPVAIWPIQE